MKLISDKKWDEYQKLKLIAENKWADYKRIFEKNRKLMLNQLYYQNTTVLDNRDKQLYDFKKKYDEQENEIKEQMNTITKLYKDIEDLQKILRRGKRK